MRESWHVDRVEETKDCWRDEHLVPDPTYRSRRCLEIIGDERHEVDVDVAVEEVVNIVLNGGCVTALPVLPAFLKEMAIGFLICEGMVKNPGEITSVRLENSSLICETRDGKAAPRKGHQCCSVGGSDIQDLKPIKSDMKMKAEAILKVVDQLNDRAKLWRRTGATHASIICDSAGQILSSCEDVSRSSSVDKTVGTALLSRVDLTRCALVTSGRLSGVMVAKAARAGFPILVSRSAPMNSGAELAQRIGMTLVGFARSPRLYVYTGKERVL